MQRYGRSDEWRYDGTVNKGMDVLVNEAVVEL